MRGRVGPLVSVMMLWAVISPGEEGSPAPEPDDEFSRSVQVLKRRLAERSGTADSRFIRPFEPHQNPATPWPLDCLRFESSLEVFGRVPPGPNASLARFFQGLDLRYGPTPGGAPTRGELEGYRPHVARGASFIPILTWLYKQTTK